MGVGPVPLSAAFQMESVLRDQLIRTLPIFTQVDTRFRKQLQNDTFPDRVRQKFSL